MSILKILRILCYSVVMLKDQELTSKIIASAFKVHKTLGSGFLEKVYENSMMIELGKTGLKSEQQARIQVLYEGSPVGEYFTDLLVEDRVIVELKAVTAVCQ